EVVVAMESSLPAFAAVTRVGCDSLQQRLALLEQPIRVGAAGLGKRVTTPAQAIERFRRIATHAFCPCRNVARGEGYRIEGWIALALREGRGQLAGGHAERARQCGVALVHIGARRRRRCTSDVLEEPVQVVERVLPAAALVVYILLDERECGGAPVLRSILDAAGDRDAMGELSDVGKV